MPDQGQYSQGQLAQLQYMMTGKNPFQDFGLRNFGLPSAGANAYQGFPTLSQYQTKPLDLQSLMSIYNQFLGGAEQRQAGQMGQQGFAQGASMGLQNPALLANRYSNQAYQNFADQYGRGGMELPQVAFNSQLGANQANFGNLAHLLGLQQGYAQMLPQGGDFGSALGGLLGAGVGAFGGPLLGAWGGAIGKKMGGG